MEKLLWVDVETTGLHPNRGFLLEIALVSTNEHLESEHTLHMPVALPEGQSLDIMTDFVRNMHEKSGLLELVEKSGVPLWKATEKCIQWVKEYKLDNLCVAGSNPFFDRSWLQFHMPELTKLFHYRSFDMNTLYYFFEIEKEIKDGVGVERRHRAIDDIMLDIVIAQKIRNLLDMRYHVKRNILNKEK